MGPLGVAGLDGLVGNEPGVATAAKVGTAGVLPALDVRLVGIGDAGGAAIEGDVSGLGEVEDVLVAVVDVAAGVDGLEMPGANRFAVSCFHGDGLNPVEGVLEVEELGPGEGEEELVGKEGIAGAAADVEEERSVLDEDAPHFGGPLAAPLEEGLPRGGVAKAAVVDPEIVGRRGDHQVDAASREFAHPLQAVAVMQVDLGRQRSRE